MRCEEFPAECGTFVFEAGVGAEAQGGVFAVALTAPLRVADVVPPLLDAEGSDLALALDEETPGAFTVGRGRNISCCFFLGEGSAVKYDFWEKQLKSTA
jgi:hypothetical protein